MSKTCLGVVAVVPFWSQSDNLNADSNYAYLRLVLPEMSRQSPDTLFLVFFPDPNYGWDRWKYVPDGFATDRIRLIPWPYDTQMRSGVCGFDPQRFGQIDKGYGPSIYWVHQVEMAAQLSGGYRQSFSQASRPTLIAQHHYIIHPSLPYPPEGLFARRWMQMGGSLASDRVVYNSDHCRRMAHESFSEFLKDTAMAEVEGKSTTLRFGLLNGDEPIAPEASPDDRPVFLYNHRFEVYKRPEITFGLFDELRKEADFQVWATQTSGQMTQGMNVDKTCYAPRREDYLANIAVPAINTINSVHETFCISMLDSLACGHLVIVPKAVTFPELVPEGYPYQFESVEEQRAMMRAVLSDWPRPYNRWRERLAQHARARFGLSGYVSDYLDLMAYHEMPRRDRMRDAAKDGTKEKIRRVFASVPVGTALPPLKFGSLFQKLKLGNQAFSSNRIVREAVEEGFAIEWQNGVILRRIR